MIITVIALRIALVIIIIIYRPAGRGLVIPIVALIRPEYVKRVDDGNAAVAVAVVRPVGLGVDEPVDRSADERAEVVVVLPAVVAAAAAEAEVGEPETNC